MEKVFELLNMGLVLTPEWKKNECDCSWKQN